MPMDSQSSQDEVSDTISTMTHCRSFPAVAASDRLIYIMGNILHY